MQRTLYIHLGPAKTGTTAVQEALRAHDNSVVVYPKVGLWSDGSHHNLVLNYFRDYSRPEIVREDVGELFDRVAAEARKSGGNIVISSETLAGRKRAAEFVEALLVRLGGGLRAEFLFVVRDHYERAASVYNQRVKDQVTSERRDPNQFLEEQSAQLCYAPLLRPLRRTQFSLRVLNYHPADTFVTRFLGCVGFPPATTSAASFRNVSLSTKALIATLEVNRFAATRDTRNRIVSSILALPGSFSPSGFIFSPRATDIAERHFGPDRTLLREKFGITFPELRCNDTQFALSREEFEEISTALSDWGSEGRAVREAVSTYIRHS